MFNGFKTFTFCVGFLAASAPIYAEKYLAINFGTSSKSLLGLSYASGKNAFNLGLLGIELKRDQDFALQPGFTYNHYFTDDGWYSTWGYSILYRSNHRTQITTTHFGIGDWERHQGSGWQPGEILMGVGKTYQWDSFALNIDGGMAISGGNEFAKPLGLRAGVGGSYRFKLN